MFTRYHSHTHVPVARLAHLGSLEIRGGKQGKEGIGDESDQMRAVVSCLTICSRLPDANKGREEEGGK